MRGEQFTNYKTDAPNVSTILSIILKESRFRQLIFVELRLINDRQLIYKYLMIRSIIDVISLLFSIYKIYIFYKVFIYCILVHYMFLHSLKGFHRVKQKISEGIITF